jgi:hypothetical protein
MEAILRKCLACGEPFTAIDRRSKLCPECRENASRGSTYRGAENPDLSCLQGTSPQITFGSVPPCGLLHVAVHKCRGLTETKPGLEVSVEAHSLRSRATSRAADSENCPQGAALPTETTRSGSFIELGVSKRGERHVSRHNPYHYPHSCLDRCRTDVGPQQRLRDMGLLVLSASSSS